MATGKKVALEILGLTKHPLKAVLFKSSERFESFLDILKQYHIETIVLDFADPSWIDFNYQSVDFIIYYPSFKFSANAPFALYEVNDNLMHIHLKYPEVPMYPDPQLIRFYNDKYRQYLFLKSNNYPTPRTIPLLGYSSLDMIDKELGYPLVLKNRYGAGGGSVFKIDNKKKLIDFYQISNFNFMNIAAFKFIFKNFFNRFFRYHLIIAKRMPYPFLTPPLLAQEYIPHEKDIKTVVGNFKVVEAHWRQKAHEKMWKVNIDAGGIGIWSKIPENVIDLSEKIARDLNTSWINIDILPVQDKFLITEFSPVWHHYRYKEKPSFIYKDDYNINVPLEKSLNLEKMIVESLLP